MPRPTTSILMPIYNAQDTLARSVGSVLGQSRDDWELLLVEDGSRDASPALAADLAARDPRVRLLVPGGNHGAAAARNHGLSQARGRYIAFLDADDRWHPDKLARQLAFMQENQIGLSYTSYARLTPDDKLIARETAPARLDYKSMLGPNRMGCLTVIYDSHRFSGPQPMPDLPLQHDYALWLRLLRLGGPAFGLDETLAYFRVGVGTLSGSKRRAVRDIWKVWRKEEGLSRAQSLAAFARYAGHSLRHRVFQRPDPSGLTFGDDTESSPEQPPSPRRG
ncbi:glycosyltransferase family 2 protein [Pseudorhodobacter sp. E13]|uniref:glycosyltransferase family 2 protein n=1 Tax=Pseudorhodobacter sp. E13 TaxID=2487931 RepID=UPI000F8DAF2E|nr:glycosyltransferase family 2 protein [Pseudorhodobacter sp. E13]RUS64842.1 glycosyltransferase family 2 protein [Pseudorhodobacter sp. E13]